MEYILKVVSFVIFTFLFIMCITSLKIKRFKANNHLKYLRKQIKKYNITSSSEAIKIINNTGDILTKL